MELLIRQRKVLESTAKQNTINVMKTVYTNNTDYIAMNPCSIYGYGDYTQIDDNICNRTFNQILETVFKKKKEVNTYCLPVKIIKENIKKLKLNLKSNFTPFIVVDFKKDKFTMSIENNIIYENNIHDNKLTGELFGKINVECKCNLNTKQFLKVLELTTNNIIHVNTIDDLKAPFIFSDDEKYNNTGMFSMIMKIRDL